MHRVYLATFTKELESCHDDYTRINKVKEKILKECRAAMRSAVPTSRVGEWEYEVPDELLGI